MIINLLFYVFFSFFLAQDLHFIFFIPGIPVKFSTLNNFITVDRLEMLKLQLSINVELLLMCTLNIAMGINIL